MKNTTAHLNLERKKTQAGATTPSDILAEIKSIILAEEIKGKHRKLQHQNGNTPRAVAMQTLAIQKEQKQIKEHFKRGNHKQHKALLRDEHHLASMIGSKENNQFGYVAPFLNAQGVPTSNQLSLPYEGGMLGQNFTRAKGSHKESEGSKPQTGGSQTGPSHSSSRSRQLLTAKQPSLHGSRESVMVDNVGAGLNKTLDFKTVKSNQNSRLITSNQDSQRELAELPIDTQIDGTSKQVAADSKKLSLMQVVQMGKMRQDGVNHIRNKSHDNSSNRYHYNASGSQNGQRALMPSNENSNVRSASQLSIHQQKSTKSFKSARHIIDCEDINKNDVVLNSMPTSRQGANGRAGPPALCQTVQEPAFITSTKTMIKVDRVDTQKSEGTRLPQLFAVSNPQSVMQSKIESEKESAIAVLSPSNGVVATLDQESTELSMQHQIYMSQLNLGIDYVNLFKARQQDLQLNTAIDLQFARFVQLIQEQNAHNKLILCEQGYAQHSAKALKKILKVQQKITQLDLSMNNLHEGFDDLLQGIMSAQNLVCLKLKNNKIDGRKHQKHLYQLLKFHPSLTAVDLGNTEHIKNRNRIYNEGFEAIVSGIAQTDDFSLISELHLQSACLSHEGFSTIRCLQPSHIDLQVLNLANNDLGDCACLHLKNLMDSLVSLNLANTKMAVKGCIELGKMIKLPSKEQPGLKSRLKYLDISQNEIGREGLNKLFQRLRTQDEIVNLNVSFNPMLNGEKLNGLNEFLAHNKTLQILNMSGCHLKTNDLMFLGQGLQKNVCLQKLILVENIFEDKDGLNFLSKGLMIARESSQLVELDLMKCSINDLSIQGITNLLSSKFKLRTLNLKDNAINDEGAQQLSVAIKVNPYLSKIDLSMNPARLYITKDIQAMVKQNTQKVAGQEIPKFKSELKHAEKMRTESLIDCCFDQRIRESVIQHLPNETQKTLSKLTKHMNQRELSRQGIVRSGSLTLRRRESSIMAGSMSSALDDHSIDRLEMLPREQKKTLLKDIKQLHQFKVCNVVQDIQKYTVELTDDHQNILTQFKELEESKEQVLESSRAEMTKLITQKEKLMDEKRELEFELIMKDQTEERIINRGEKNLREMKQKIELAQLGQKKIQDQIDEVHVQKNMKHGTCDLMRSAFQAELDKVEQKDRVTKIIYDIYLKELETFHELQAEQDEADRLRREEEARRAAELELQRLEEEKKALKQSKKSLIKIALKKTVSTVKESPKKSPTKAQPFSFGDGTQGSPHKRQLQRQNSSPSKLQKFESPTKSAIKKDPLNVKVQAIANAMLEKIGVPKYEVEKTLANFQLNENDDDDKQLRLQLQSASGVQ